MRSPYRRRRRLAESAMLDIPSLNMHLAETFHKRIVNAVVSTARVSSYVRGLETRRGGKARPGAYSVELEGYTRSDFTARLYVYAFGPSCVGGTTTTSFVGVDYETPVSEGNFEEEFSDKERPGMAIETIVRRIEEIMQT